LLYDFVRDTGKITDGVADVFQARGSGDFAALGDGHLRI
jgi:hypothetical protein